MANMVNFMPYVLYHNEKVLTKLARARTISEAEHLGSHLGLGGAGSWASRALVSHL